LIGDDKDVGGLLIPQFLTRVVAGTINVRDGETALIGGLIQGRDVDNLSGIIGLQSIPILNRLFNSPSKTRTNSEILISLTPHVVRGPKLKESDLASLYVGTRETLVVPGARPPLLGPEETPTPPPAPAPTAPPPSNPPVGVAPPAPPVPAPDDPAPAVEMNGAAAGAPPSGGPGAAPGAGAPGGPVPDAPAVPILFSPPEVSVKAGDLATFSLVVLRVKDLMSVDINLTFDGEALEVVDVEPGSLLTLDGAKPNQEKNIDAGKVHAHFTRPTGTAGSGAVATIRIKGKKPGPATIGIESLAVITPTGRIPATLPGPGRVVVLP
jgi:general secretion pathway protein D